MKWFHGPTNRPLANRDWGKLRNTTRQSALARIRARNLTNKIKKIKYVMKKSFNFKSQNFGMRPRCCCPMSSFGVSSDRALFSMFIVGQMSVLSVISSNSFYKVFPCFCLAVNWEKKTLHRLFTHSLLTFCKLTGRDAVLTLRLCFWRAPDVERCRAFKPREV